MEHLQAALKLTQVKAPTQEQFSAVGRQIGYAGYLIFDAVAWVRHAVGTLWLAFEI
jgi:peroxin-11B